jgi:hypothetical protein
VAGGAGAHGEAAAPRFIGLLFHHDVDDPRDTFRILPRRWVGNDLDLVHHGGGKLREVVAELSRLQRAGTAVQLDDHIRIAAQAHDVVDVDVHSGDIAEHIERRAALGRRHVAHDVGRPIGRNLYIMPLSRDFKRLQLHRCGHQGDGSQIHDRRRRDRDRAQPPRRETDGGDVHTISAGWNALDFEAALRIGSCVGYRAGRPGVDSVHDCHADRGLVRAADHAAADSPGGPLREGRHARRDKQEDRSEDSVSAHALFY